MARTNRMNVLVAGCAGFIGAHVARLLLETGHTVQGVDISTRADGAPLQQCRLARLQAHPAFTLYRLDISDIESVQSKMKEMQREEEISAIINLAGRGDLRGSVGAPLAHYQVNTLGSLNLLEMCREFRIGKFVLASTSGVYSANITGPTAEDAESSRPPSPYGASKKAAEALMYSYHHLHGIDAIALRLFTVYGPAGRPDMSIFRFVRGIVEGEVITVYGNGTQQRDFIYVDDVAHGTVAALSLRGYEVVNLGTNRPVAINDVIRSIEKVVGREARVDYQEAHPADAMATWADSSRARDLLGWTPAVTIEEGIRRTVGWYMENRDWAKSLT